MITIRAATPEEDAIVAHHFYYMWRDNQVPDRCIQPEWLTITQEFIAHARQNLHYQAFMAEVDGVVVGSVSGQRFAGLYPQILTADYRQYGYIWGVYVEPAYRKQGIATQLMEQAIVYLRSLQCTRIILHASPSGKPIYEQLGFSTTNEMRLDLEK